MSWFLKPLLQSKDVNGSGSTHDKGQNQSICSSETSWGLSSTFPFLSCLDSTSPITGIQCGGAEGCYGI
jgi:hypothetical protein